MRDPFKPNTNKQLVREAQFGFTVIGLLVATLIYVAWFRLSGRHDMAPQHIRDAPVAARVFPNSPNYDRESHQMMASGKSTFAQSTPTRPILVDAPKRVMEDSRNTARSLSEMADTMDQSVTKVASLLKPSPTTEKPELVVSDRGNPASSGSGDSGFKILKQPVVAVENVAGPTKKTPTKAPTSPPNEFKPLVSVPEFEPNPAPKVEPPQLETSNEFKPLVVDKKLPSASLATPMADTSEPKISIEQLKLPKLPPPDRPAPFTLEPFKPKADPSTAKPATIYSPKQSTAVSVDVEPKPTDSLVKTVSYEVTTWKVKKGDSYWSIAQSQYGDGRFFRALYEQNRRVVPGFEDLSEGVELEIPSEAELIRDFPDFCPADAVHRNDPWRETPDDMMEGLTDSCESDLDQRLYETRPGDTLFEVARRQLGQASRYTELIDLNRFRIDENATHETELPVGIELLLPEK
jgi:hypothetical protein